MAKLEAVTPLSGRALAGAGFQFSENTEYDLVRLQVFHRRTGLVEQVAERLGIVLPERGQVLAEQDWLIFWSAPGEWVIAAPSGQATELAGRLASELEGSLAVVSEMTDSRVTVDIAGEAVRSVLARGSSLDFDPSCFGKGHCVTTRLAGVPVMLATPHSDDQFVLFACRSVGDYLFEWFTAASKDVV